MFSLFGALLVASAQPTQAVTFEDILAGADKHPRLEARDAAIRARRRGDDAISSVSRNPTLQVLPGWRLPGAEDPGFEVQAQLSHPVSLGGRGAARRRAADAERAQLDVARRADVLAVRLEAARAWLSLWGLQHVLRMTQQERALAGRLVERARRSTEVGAGLATDVVEAELYELGLERAEIDAEGMLYEHAVELAAALGRDAAVLPEASGDPPQATLPPPGDWAAWIERAYDLPAVHAERLSARAADARAAEEAANGAGWITPTVTAQLERPGDVLVFAGLSLQLPLFAGNDRARALAKAEAVQAGAAAHQRSVSARRALRLAFHEVEHKREIEAQIRDKILPAVQRWVAQSQRRYEAGEAEVFSTLRARVRLVEARSRLVEAVEARRWAEVKAWLLLATLTDAAAKEPR